MSGGNDKGTYYAGLGYNKSEGLPISSFMSVIALFSMAVISWLIGLPQVLILITIVLIGVLCPVRKIMKGTISDV